MKQTEILTHATHVNGWEPAVYMSCMSQNFRFFHVSNLSVRNFRIFLLMYPGSVSRASSWAAGSGRWDGSQRWSPGGWWRRPAPHKHRQPRHGRRRCCCWVSPSDNTAPHQVRRRRRGAVTRLRSGPCQPVTGPSLASRLARGAAKGVGWLAGRSPAAWHGDGG